MAPGPAPRHGARREPGPGDLPVRGGPLPGGGGARRVRRAPRARRAARARPQRGALGARGRGRDPGRPSPGEPGRRGAPPPARAARRRATDPRPAAPDAVRPARGHDHSRRSRRGRRPRVRAPGGGSAGRGLPGHGRIGPPPGRLRDRDARGRVLRDPDGRPVPAVVRVPRSGAGPGARGLPHQPAQHRRRAGGRPRADPGPGDAGRRRGARRFACSRTRAPGRPSARRCSRCEARLGETGAGLRAARAVLRERDGAPRR